MYTLPKHIQIISSWMFSTVQSRDSASDHAAPRSDRDRLPGTRFCPERLSELGYFDSGSEVTGVALLPGTARHGRPLPRAPDLQAGLKPGGPKRVAAPA